MSKHLNAGFMLIFITVIYLLHSIYLACVAEDSYITFRFAQNLANGHGFVWNIGETPVEGFTNFLWVVICSGLIKLGLPIPLMSQVIGISFSLGTIWITYRYALNILQLKSWQALLPVLLLACSGPFATWSTSGMETNIFGFFLITACYFNSLYWRTNSVRNLWYSFFTLFLATLTRPEGFIIFILLLSFSLTLIPGQSKNSLKNIIPSIAFFLIPFAIYFIWRYNYFGYLLPNTFYAKTGGGTQQYFRGIVLTGFFYIYFILPLFIIPVLAVIFGKIKIKDFFSGVMLPDRNIISIAEHLRSYVGQYQCLLIITIYTAYIIYVGGDYMAMFRFFVPIIPLLCLICSYALVTIFKQYKKQNKHLIFSIGLTSSIALIIIQSTPLEKEIFPKMPYNHGTYRGVMLERWHVSRLSLIGHYFNNIKTGYQDSLATGGIGAIAYNADMRIIGLHGLVDTFIAHKTFAPGTLGKGLPGHERGDLSYIFSKNPTYFMFTRKFKQQQAEIPKSLLQEVSHVIQENYELESVWLEDKENQDSGFFTYLKKKNSAQVKNKSLQGT